jgi:hypothetical protein
MFALAAILLLAGIICVIVVEASEGYEGVGRKGDITALRIASYVSQSLSHQSINQSINHPSIH